MKNKKYKGLVQGHAVQEQSSRVGPDAGHVRMSSASPLLSTSSTHSVYRSPTLGYGRKISTQVFNASVRAHDAIESATIESGLKPFFCFRR